MADANKGEITVLLERVSDGDPTAEEALLPRVYSELHRLALSRMRSERQGHTLQPTALVHEVYLRLCRSNQIDWQNRGHFFRIAARLMRRVLVDHARQRVAHKRQPGQPMASLDGVILISEDQSFKAIEIDQVLNQLAAVSPRQAQVVEMRFFAGLSEEEIAEVLGKNVRTIKRDWLMARAWLHQQLESK
jgi:RNA polymerase sigma-70 factor (ECF subfamily)